MKLRNIMVQAICAAAIGVTGIAGPTLAVPDDVAARPAAKAAAAGRWHPSVGKPRPPVEVRLVPAAGLESGVPAELVLQVRSRMPLDDIRLTAEGDAGLSLVGPPRAPNLDSGEGRSPADGELARFEISVTPASGGTRYVSGLVTYRINGVTQAAPFSLPIKVGGPVTVPAVARKPDRPPVRDANGELIDSMPAETTVR